MLVAVGFSPPVVKTRLSDERCVSPDAARTAPPVAAELSQPLPGPPGGFEQGQAITPPIPGSHRLVMAGPPWSWTKTSTVPFVSPLTRLLARLVKATKLPFAEIAAR